MDQWRCSQPASAGFARPLPNVVRELSENGRVNVERREDSEKEKPTDFRGFVSRRIVKLVEAAGVEPASEDVTGEATPCSASSEFSSHRLEKRQNGGKTTPNLFRRFVRGTEAATPAFDVGVRGAAGALLMKPSLRVNYAARARLLLLAAIVFPRFGEVVGLGMQPLACSSPSKPFRPRAVSGARSSGSKIEGSP
jgi:hypothetical protein